MHRPNGWARAPGLALLTAQARAANPQVSANAATGIADYEHGKLLERAGEA